MKPGESNLKHTQELVAFIDSEIKKIKKASTPSEISKSERRLLPVLKELQISAIRVWDDVSKASRDRRLELRDLA